MASNSSQNVTNSQLNEFKVELKVEMQDMLAELHASMLETLHGKDIVKKQIEEYHDPRRKSNTTEAILNTKIRVAHLFRTIDKLNTTHSTISRDS